MSDTRTPYLKDSTVRRFEATVERALDDRIVLDRTHFYPEGGGQPADRGTIATIDPDGGAGGSGGGDGGGSGAATERWRVTDVQKKDTIYHTLEGDPPAEGRTVRGELDWERRRAHMRYHTAQHLVSAMCLDEYDAPTRGNQIRADGARIDVEYDRFTGTDLADIEARLNELVADGRPVRWYTMDRAAAEADLDPERTRIELLPDSITELRIVEVGGDGGPYDRTACAGTHVGNTEAVGSVTVTGRTTAGSGRERIEFELEGT